MLTHDAAQQRHSPRAVTPLKGMLSHLSWNSRAACNLSSRSTSFLLSRKSRSRLRFAPPQPWHASWSYAFMNVHRMHGQSRYASAWRSNTAELLPARCRLWRSCEHGFGTFQQQKCTGISVDAHHGNLSVTGGARTQAAPPKKPCLRLERPPASGSPSMSVLLKCSKRRQSVQMIDAASPHGN